MWKSVLSSKSANQSRFMRHFFCPLHSHALVMAAYSGQSQDWPLLLERYFHPCLGCHHSVEGMLVGSKPAKSKTTMTSRSYSAYTRTSNNIIEHTPVYDPNAYRQQQKQIQRINRLKDTIAFLAFIALALILFSLGGAA